MQLNAAGAEREPALAPRTPSSRACRQQALLLSENATLLAGPPPLFQWLSPRERELVLSHGRRRVLNHGQTLFSQGTTQPHRERPDSCVLQRPVGARDHASLLV